MSSQSSDLQSATETKIATAKQKKDSGDQAFKKGNVKSALFSYHESLMYLLGLDKNALQSIGIGNPGPPAKGEDGKEIKEKTEIDEMLEKIYANMSACHIKNGNWQRAIDTADKALAKNEANYKAMFRKGKALGEMGFYEKAVKVLESVKEKSPSDGPAVTSELSRLRAIDNERERVHKQKLKGFLNRDPKMQGTSLVQATSEVA